MFGFTRVLRAHVQTYIGKWKPQINYSHECIKSLTWVFARCHKFIFVGTKVWWQDGNPYLVHQFLFSKFQHLDTYLKFNTCFKVCIPKTTTELKTTTMYHKQTFADIVSTPSKGWSSSTPKFNSIQFHTCLNLEIAQFVYCVKGDTWKAIYVEEVLNQCHHCPTLILNFILPPFVK